MWLRFIFTVLMAMSFTYAGEAQSKYGLEISYANLRTHNTGALSGASYHFIWYEVIAERDAYARSVALAFSYALHKNHLLKFSLAAHQNGTALDYEIADDGGGHEIRLNEQAPYRYAQLALAYQFRTNIKRFYIPLEMGLAINKIRGESNRITLLRKYNWDLQLSSGLHYRIAGPVVIGANAVYMKNVGEYQSMYEWGTYKPELIGWEAVLGLSF